MPTKLGAQWIDVPSPAKKDLEWLAKKFHLHPIITEELAGPSARSHVESYDHYLYLIYYFPVYDPKEQTSRRTEIDFLITKDHVVTVHYEDIEALAYLKDRTDTDSFRLTYKILESLFNFQERQLRHIREKTEAIGSELFKDDEKNVLRKISRLKRDISEYRIIVRHQGPILKSLLGNGLKFWGDDARVYLEDLVGDHTKITDQVNGYRDAVGDFEDTNNQLMSVKTNEVMKTFTTLSFLTFPFMLLAAIFSMNTKGTPIVDLPNSFWIILSGMGIAMVTLIAYFKKKEWL
ncbi:MAG: magnesium transporter CorA family protein [Candidatus Liptonbacteria bacterium]|nr:magnesium transporter CorA family protein [Candidatus Liptonbacteria bacterium]